MQIGPKCFETSLDTNIVPVDMSFGPEPWQNSRWFVCRAGTGIVEKSSTFLSISGSKASESPNTGPILDFAARSGGELSLKPPAATVSSSATVSLAGVFPGIEGFRFLNSKLTDANKPRCLSVDLPQPLQQALLIAPPNPEELPCRTAHGDIPDMAGKQTSPDDDRPGAAIFTIDADDPIIVIEHCRKMEVPYGTLALWINPNSIRGIQTLAAQDEHQPGDCGRFRLAMASGRLFLGIANPHDHSRHDWVSEAPVYKQGRWTHIAMTFDNRGAALFIDGTRLADHSWRRVAGSIATPSAMVDFSLENNSHPIVLGCEDRDSGAGENSRERITSGIAEQHPFAGRIGAFGLWGGYAPGDGLDAGQIRMLANHSPEEIAVLDTGNSSGPRTIQQSDRGRDQISLRSRNWGLGRKYSASTQQYKRAAL